GALAKGAGTGNSMAKRVKKSVAARSPRPLPLGEQQDAIERITAALERIAPAAPAAPQFSAADAFAWHPERRRLVPVSRNNRGDITLLKGIDRVRDTLIDNTSPLARGLP